MIGVVTSPTGAVIRDILHRLEDRFPCRVMLWPVPVQGEGAAEKIAAAVARLQRPGRRRRDLLIVARGGGSIEDLWAFNEEVVVRAVAGSPIPIISAVGHETDTTLTDFAADVRAPTPTAAAEIAVPVRAELLAQVARARRPRRTLRAAHGRARGASSSQSLLRHWPEREALLAPQRQRVDELAERLPRALARPARPGARRARPRRRRAAPGTAESAHERAKERLAALWRVAELAHPERPLKRGYALVKDRAGQVLTSAAAAREARLLRLAFGDGEVDGARLSGRAGAPYPKEQGRPAQIAVKAQGC